MIDLSQFGRRLSGESGIVSLMDDLGDALNVNPDMLFLGGGNPAAIPEFERLIGTHLNALVNEPDQLHKLLGVYQSPQGNERFISLLAKYFNERCGWPVSEENIAITNGSQSAFFLLLNMLAGERADKGRQEPRNICLPMAPEYLGYGDQILAPGGFRSTRPLIELVGEHGFKYNIDFDRLNINESTAALCVSRPTNPTGNVITDKELARLNELSLRYEIPLIIDCAYGLPFPGIVYGPAELQWQANNIFVLSLSKLGLPGVRTGIVVASKELIAQLVSANTIVSLANGNLGPMLGASLLQDNSLDRICSDVLLPYYQGRRALMLALLEKHFHGLCYRVHKSEGAFFVWLWFPELTISSDRLYERLKKRQVLIMAGEHFFFGLEQPWEHSKQCVRLNFCQSDAVLETALAIIAEELRKATVP